MTLPLDELPEGWTLAQLSEVGMIRSEPIDPSRNPDVEYELWSVPSFATGAPEYKRGREIESGKQIVRDGDILLCKINPRINRVWRVGSPNGRPQIASTEWIVVRNPDLEPSFLLHQMREQSFRERLLENVSGVGGSLMRARPEGIRVLDLAIAPLAEQSRLVAKIEALQARSRKAREALEGVPALLEQFRQSVLAAAFRGDLTAAWREQHPNLEPASVLLDRIRQERRHRWEQSNPKKKYTEPNPVDDADLPELPDGWCWATIEQISRNVSDGVHRKPSYVASGVPFITVKNLTCGPGISFDDTKFISQTDHAEFIKRTHPEKGDILVTKDGATLGRVRVIETDIVFSIFVSVALIKPVITSMSSFLTSMLEAPQGQVAMKITGTGIPHIHLVDLRATVIPLPPIAEQVEIRRRIDQYFNVITNVSESTLTNLGAIDQLDQSILAKAFRGELVPQDPNDEPASVLLDRIRAEREQATGSPTKSNGRAPRRQKRKAT